MNAAIFEARVEQSLIPDIPKNAIAVMDNLSAQKGERVREVIEAAGGEVLYLPPHSPDLNPILEAQALAQGCTGNNNRKPVEHDWNHTRPFQTRRMRR